MKLERGIVNGHSAMNYQIIDADGGTDGGTDGRTAPFHRPDFASQSGQKWMTLKIVSLKSWHFCLEINKAVTSLVVPCSKVKKMFWKCVLAEWIIMVLTRFVFEWYAGINCSKPLLELEVILRPLRMSFGSLIVFLTYKEPVVLSCCDMIVFLTYKEPVVLSCCDMIVFLTYKEHVVLSCCDMIVFLTYKEPVVLSCCDMIVYLTYKEPVVLSCCDTSPT